MRGVLMVLMLSAMTAAARDAVVFFAAHPDDTEGFAATAFLLKEKYDVRVVDFTCGERGCGEENYLNGWTKAKRMAEEKSALALLDAEPFYVGEIDGEACATPRAVSEMIRFLKELKPKAVFTHWPVDLHRDHRQCAIAAMQAVQSIDFKPELYFFEVLMEQTRNWNPLYSVDVTRTMGLKQALLRKYESQNKDDELVRHKTRQAALRGSERRPAVKYAETFTTLDGRRIEGGVLESLPETASLRANADGSLTVTLPRDDLSVYTLVRIGPADAITRRD